MGQKKKKEDDPSLDKVPTQKIPKQKVPKKQSKQKTPRQKVPTNKVPVHSYRSPNEVKKARIVEKVKKVFGRALSSQELSKVRNVENSTLRPRKKSTSPVKQEFRKQKKKNNSIPKSKIPKSRIPKEKVEKQKLFSPKKIKNSSISQKAEDGLRKNMIRKAKIVRNKIIKKKYEQKPYSDFIEPTKKIDSKEISESRKKKVERQLSQTVLNQPVIVQNSPLPEDTKEYQVTKPTRTENKEIEKLVSVPIRKEVRSERPEPITKRAKELIQKQLVRIKKPKEHEPRIKRPKDIEPKTKRPK